MDIIKQLKDSLVAASKGDRTVYSIAKVAGLKPELLYRFIRGESSLQLSSAAKLADALGLVLVPSGVPHSSESITVCESTAVRSQSPQRTSRSTGDEVCLDRSPLTHICFGGRTEEDVDWFRDAESRGDVEFYPHNITRRARQGDQVVIYLRAPVSAFIAIGTVGREVSREDVESGPYTEHAPLWRSGSSFFIGSIRMLRRRISLDEAKRNLPDWSYLSHPVITSLPNTRTSMQVVERFLQLLQVG